ncbi:Ubiquitin carboxyl-terminal hydrolase 19 [Halotydeus destructor]|nr:Ubiquitin carboxyl-terminal hydrolase 19 [Halotydeus destructor]
MVLKQELSPVTGNSAYSSLPGGKATDPEGSDGAPDTIEDMDTEGTNLAPLFDSDDDARNSISPLGISLNDSMHVNSSDLTQSMGDYDHSGELDHNEFEGAVFIGSDKCRLDHYEKGKDVAVLTAYLKATFPPEVKFEEKRISIIFSTNDPKLLKFDVKSYPEDQKFVASIPLKCEIMPDKCHYTKSATKIELYLQKKSSEKWEKDFVDSENWKKTEYSVNGHSEVSLLEPVKPHSAIPLPPPLPSPQPSGSQSYARHQPTSTSSWLPKLKPPRIGFTGLDNLGNTCFMNSVIQCLSNTSELREYCLSSEFKQDINRDNPLGSGGNLAIAFAVLLKHLWSGQHNSYSSQKLKSLMGEKVQQFSGFGQHDAQEYMAYLLDGIHEDVNRILQKPYVEMKSSDEEDFIPDETLADDSWKKYRMRNDSVIVDLFQGQYKSKLVCPECKKHSVTFDPFLYLSVPLPKNKVVHSIYFFSKDASRKPEKYVFKLAADARVSSMLDYMKERTECKKLKAMLVSNGSIRRLLKSSEVMPQIGSSERSSMILVFDILTEEDAGEPVIEFIVNQNLVIPKHQSDFCVYCKSPAESPLKKCTKCFRVGYCDKKCQASDWEAHKQTCRFEREPVGCPFIVSLPFSKCTYKYLQRVLSEYSRYSVDVQGVSRKNSVASENGEEDYEPIPKKKFKITYYPDIVLPDVQNNSTGVMLDDPSETEEMENDPVIVDSTCLKASTLRLDWLNNPYDKKCVYVDSKDLDHSYNALDVSKELKSDDFLSLEGCLRAFTEPEVLTEQEAWYCPKCKKHQEATKQLQLWRLPPLLIVQLKRFSFRNMLFREKIDKFVEYPLTGLNLSEYCSPNAHREGLAKQTYDLYAVINHYGGMFGGHYVAYAKTTFEGQDLSWRVFDDSKVDEIKESEVVNKNAYILFYRLREDVS